MLIPIGCVLGGAVHDYFSGMMSLRHGGEQMPGLMKRFMGVGWYQIYNVFVCLLMFLVGVVFIYTPGDMLAGSILGFSTSFVDASTGSMASWSRSFPCWAIYLIILLVLPGGNRVPDRYHHRPHLPDLRRHPFAVRCGASS